MKAHFYMQYNFLTTVDFAILTILFFSKSIVAVDMTPKLCIYMHYVKSYMFKVKSAGKKAGKWYNTNSNIAFSVLIILFFSKSIVAVDMTPKFCIYMHYLKSYMFKDKSAGKKAGKWYNTNSNIDFSVLITLFFSISSIAVDMTPNLCIYMHYLKSYMFKVKSAGKKAGKWYNINSNIAFSILMTLFFSKSSVPVNMRPKSYICSS